LPAILFKEQDSLNLRIIQFFEKIRMAYLSALSNPKTYRKKWVREIKLLREEWDSIDEFGKAIKEKVSEKELFSDEANDINSDTARRIYDNIKELRYSSEMVKDPFAKEYGEDVLDELVESPSLLAAFIHWAMRSHDKALPESSWEEQKAKPDLLTEGFKGLNLEEDHIVDFIVEHYGDGKDTKRIKGKYEASKDLLEEVFTTNSSSKHWEEVVSLKKAEKSDAHFLVPNKPMYRIFDIEDLRELKGFSGKYVVQEKYDGMRIQIHKIDKQIKIFSYNGNDITDKCPEQKKLMAKKYFGDCILDAELMLFENDTPLHRAETIARVFKNKKSEATLKAHVFDIMRHEDEDVYDQPLKNRIQTLFNNYSTHSNELLAFPSKKDTKTADSIEEVEKYAKDIMELPASEGVVIKDIESTYFIGTKKNPKWIKWKKFVDLDLIILDKKTTKSNMFTYTLGAGPLLESEEYSPTKDIDGKTYLNVGKALNTKTDVDVGSIIRVKVDEVKKHKTGFKLYSAKVIEVPEVEAPEKLITLDLLSKDTKKSLNYDIKALEKGYSITDNIHGETTLIIKSDLEGFILCDYDRNLMAKNALLDFDVWKTQIEDMLKDEKGYFRVSIKNHIMEEGKELSFKKIEEYVKKELMREYSNLFGSSPTKLMKWLRALGKSGDEDIIYVGNNMFAANMDNLAKDIDLKKAYKTPPKYQEGKFKVYFTEAENLSLMLKLSDETIGWEIDLESENDIFSLFGKSGKYPAKVLTNFRKGKVIDSGSVKLGVQRHGYHEYMLSGNKFETKFHVRVIPVKGKEMWLAWTGLETKPVSPDSDDGIWNITEDKHAKLEKK